MSQATSTDIDVCTIYDLMKQTLTAIDGIDFDLTLNLQSPLQDWKRGRLDCSGFGPSPLINLKALGEKESAVISVSPLNGNPMTIGIPEGGRVVLGKHHCQVRDDDTVLVCEGNLWYPAPKVLLEQRLYAETLTELELQEGITICCLDGYMFLRCEDRFWMQCK